MKESLPSEKVFPFRMAAWLLGCYRSYLRWLRGLLERLGHDCTLSVWQEACQGAEDELLLHILSTGWSQDPAVDAAEVESSISRLSSEYFSVAIEGVAAEQARGLVESMPPLHLIRETFAVYNVWQEITAHKALHLRMHGIARLCEALIHHHGKQGELIAYDLLREGRIQAHAGKTVSVAEFMADFLAEPEEASLWSVGLESELVSASESEVVLHIKACAWARYFQEHHPTVGYLVACSTDEAEYRALNADLRLQRTCTLMEGGAVCDFRIYVTGETEPQMNG